MMKLKILCFLSLTILIPGGCSLDHGISPETQGITGRVTFVGTWPDTIIEARIVVLSHFPPSSILDIAGYSDAISPDTKAYDYLVELSPGKYPFVGAVCRAGSVWDERSLQCTLGFYGNAFPETVEVESGEFLSGIDIHVTFGGAR